MARGNDGCCGDRALGMSNQCYACRATVRTRTMYGSQATVCCASGTSRPLYIGRWRVRSIVQRRALAALAFDLAAMTLVRQTALSGTGRGFGGDAFALAA